MSQGTAKSDRKPESIEERTDRPVIVEAKNLIEQLESVSERIAQRAYEFFQTKGQQFGNDIDDWLHAEFELLRPAPVEISETEDQLKVRAEVPGFAAKDIKVSVEPRRVLLSGKTKQSAEKSAEKIIYTEWRSEEILRTVDLPKEVDPGKVTAKLQDGVLTLSMAKLKVPEPVDIPVG
jgi:HSP20 family protein